MKIGDKIFLLIIGIVIVSVFIFIFSQTNSSDSVQGTSDQTIDSVISEDGTLQTLDLTAKGGYQPAELYAKADIPILLKVNTKNTYDCSRAFTIPEYDINENLPTNGVTEIELPAKKSGEEIIGNCSMGMYFFKIVIV